MEQANLRGFVTFATAGRDTRTTRIFINLVDNKRLDATGFSPFGQVVSGMEVVDHLNTEYGEGPPGGPGPDQEVIEAEGNGYLEQGLPPARRGEDRQHRAVSARGIPPSPPPPPLRRPARAASRARRRSRPRSRCSTKLLPEGAGAGLPSMRAR